MQTRFNVKTALAALESGAAGPLHTGGCFGPLGGGGINCPTINIVADAMDHKILMTQLQMIVNRDANDLQPYVQVVRF